MKKRENFFLMFVLVIFLAILFIILSFIRNEIYFVSASEVQANISFEINQSKGILVHKNNFSGETSNFEAGNQVLSSLTNMRIEDLSYGRVRFLSVINLTQDAVSSTNNLYNRFVDLDSNILFSDGYLNINTSALTSLENKTAEISFYNLSFINPKILRNGADCPENICYIINYSDGILVFNVTQFSTYSVEEGTEEGGLEKEKDRGAGGRIILPDFKIDRETIKIRAGVGDTFKASFKIKNLKNKRIPFKIDTNLDAFIIFSEKSFSLGPKEEKEIFLTFYSVDDSDAGVHVGKIEVISEQTTKKINVAFEVESRKILFDVSVDILDKFLYVLPGNELLSVIRIFNLGAPKKVDVTINYEIINEDGEVILFESEMLAIETQTRISKMFYIPKDADTGTYLLYVKVTYDEEISSASGWFFVEKEPISLISKILYISSIVLIILILAILYEIRKIKKHLKIHHRIDEYILMKKRLIK